jgi:GNAT superfamily N-acetyltransferase
MSAKVSVREAKESDAPRIAQVHVDSWRTAYTGVVPQDYLDNLSVEERERRWKRILRGDPESYESRDCVAESSEAGIVGFSSVGPVKTSERPGWELYAIYLLQSWQGSGLGRKLFAGALESADSGIPVITWCISANPSRRFYEALGGESLKTQMIEIGGVSLEETCYGWQDAYELRNKLMAEC